MLIITYFYDEKILTLKSYNATISDYKKLLLIYLSLENEQIKASMFDTCGGGLTANAVGSKNT
jgi:hypothetical protein